MRVHGAGEQTRDFTFVGDVVRGILLAGFRAGVSGRIYNIAAGRPVSVVDLGKTLARLAGRAPDFEFGPPRAGDVLHSFADVDRARRELGFAAEVPLEEGLRRTLEWVPA